MRFEIHMNHRDGRRYLATAGDYPSEQEAHAFCLGFFVGAGGDDLYTFDTVSSEGFLIINLDEK